MMLELVHDLDADALRPRVTSFDVGDRRHDKPEMVQALRVAAVFTAMEREIVASRAQVRVVRVGLPDQLHPEHANIKILRALDVGNLERQMTHAAIFDQLFASRVL